MMVLTSGMIRCDFVNGHTISNKQCTWAEGCDTHVRARDGEAEEEEGRLSLPKRPPGVQEPGGEKKEGKGERRKKRLSLPKHIARRRNGEEEEEKIGRASCRERV